VASVSSPKGPHTSANDAIRETMGSQSRLQRRAVPYDYRGTVARAYAMLRRSTSAGPSGSGSIGPGPWRAGRGNGRCRPTAGSSSGLQQRSRWLRWAVAAFSSGDSGGL
jgi:hypothetical protein